jgi:zeaxanthin glucosyltransferase
MKVGFVSMPLSGHLNPMTALARRLQSQGNDVVLFGVPDVEPNSCCDKSLTLGGA